MSPRAEQQGATMLQPQPTRHPATRVSGATQAKPRADANRDPWSESLSTPRRGREPRGLACSRQAPAPAGHTGHEEPRARV